MANYLYEKINYIESYYIFLAKLISVDMDMHIHDEMEILCVESGDMYVLVNNTKYHLYPGDIIVINAFEPHGTLKGTQECMHTLLQFNPFNIFSNIDFMKNMICEGYCIKKEEKSHLEFYNNIQNLYRVYNSNSLTKELGVKGYLSVLYADIVENLPWKKIILSNMNQSQIDIMIFQKVIQYICDNYDQPIALEEISQIAGFSVYHFCRFFKRMSNRTFIEYLTQLRINKSIILLCTVNKDISEIATLSGFSSIKTFNRVFKKIHGMSPREYRRVNAN